MSSSKKGKLTYLLPIIWLDEKSPVVNFDLADNSYESSSKPPYQSISENLEQSKEKEKIDYILKNPNQWPSLYFANELKSNMATQDLLKFLDELKEPFISSPYFLKIKSYSIAKSREPVKIGRLVEDFALPDKTGDLQSILKNKDKTKLVALFSSGCSFSIASISLLSQLNEINNDKIEIITIWDDPNENSWKTMHADKKEVIT